MPVPALTKIMGVKKLLHLVSMLFCFISVLPAQPGISGKIDLDSTKWAPLAYLSIIPDFGQLHTISYDLIVDSAPISADGSFRFQTRFLSGREQLYRIHFSKNGDPPSSLIIGGRDHNHTFLLASNSADIEITFLPGKKLLNGVAFRGYIPNQALVPIHAMVALLDSLDNFGTSLNRAYLRKATQQQLRDYADTCSFPLVSLYAIYQSNFLSDYEVNRSYYKKYLRKWRSEKSVYFDVFREDINAGSRAEWQLAILVAFALFIFVYLVAFSRRKNRPRSALSKLSIQERKVFNCIKEGKSNKEIADELAVSLSTVKSHANNIYSKLGINSRKEIMDIV